MRWLPARESLYCLSFVLFSIMTGEEQCQRLACIYSYILHQRQRVRQLPQHSISQTKEITRSGNTGKLCNFHRRYRAGGETDHTERAAWFCITTGDHIHHRPATVTWPNQGAKNEADAKKRRSRWNCQSGRTTDRSARIVTLFVVAAVATRSLLALST